MSLPCVRGGGRRGTSLTEGLLHTRKSDFDTPSASRSFGTSLHEGGKRARARTRQGAGRDFTPCGGKRAGALGVSRGAREGTSLLPPHVRSAPPSTREARVWRGGAVAIFAGSLNKTTRKRKGPMSFLIGSFLAIGLSINQTVVNHITSLKKIVVSIVLTTYSATAMKPTRLRLSSYWNAPST